MAMNAKCECGGECVKGGRVCFDCRDKQLRKNKGKPRPCALNRCENDTDAPISNDVLRACGGKC